MHGALAHLRFWWDYRRSAVIGLVVSIAAVLIIVIIVASATLPARQPTEPVKVRTICGTTDCLQMAQRLQDSMNKSVDPCDDFYLFACERWDYVSNISIWQTASNNIQHDIRDTKEALMNGQSRPTDAAESYFVDFIQHCRKDVPEWDPVLAELDNLGGYPLFGTQKVPYNWLEAEARLAHVNHNQAVFLVRFDIDPKRKDRRIIRIGYQPSMFPDTFLRTRTAVMGLEHFLHDVSDAYRRILNITTNNTETDIRDQIASLLGFAGHLNKILQASQKAAPERMTIRDLSNKVPEVDWLTYLNILINPILDEVTEIRSGDPIIVENTETLSKLTAFIARKEHQREVANYIGYKFIVNSILFSPYTDVQHAFYSFSEAYAVKFDRNMKCKELAETLKLVYYHHYFKINLKKFAEPRALILHMLWDVTKQFESTMKTAKWIDKQTRELLLRKLKRIQHFVGYPDWLLNGDNVYRFYDMDGAPNRSRPFLTRLTYHRVRLYQKQIRELNANIPCAHFAESGMTSPAKLSMLHTRLGTSIAKTHFAFHQPEVYAGMLLKPFIFLRAPRYVNYGTVGFVAGHEIIHAFDDRGTTIDEHGVDFRSDPWPRATREEFLKRMRSIIRFYEDEFQIDGNYTRNENLADMSAIRFSFSAYKEDPNSEAEPVLPGFEDYTSDQLYFLSFASIWCNNNKYDNTSIHGPHSSRVNGPLMNLQEFSDVYKCSPGSRMNPKDKRVVWG
ncbi:endothelin-converting enzyme 1-like isoform X2 [Ornithodoros turicata]|uniref:endothelin-converting enzyme 1-like isoform X2 n=1 Tax=Ornithodoros turicata TaxID=34597 RepID=UPI00313873C0